MSGSNEPVYRVEYDAPGGGHVGETAFSAVQVEMKVSDAASQGGTNIQVTPISSTDNQRQQ